MTLIEDLVWINESVGSKENISFINKIKDEFKIKIASFCDVESGIKYISNCITFKLVIIIVSGKLFPLYLETIKKYINNLTSIPITIILTSNKKQYKEQCACKEEIGDEFYDMGGVADSFQDIKKFLKKYLMIKPSINKNKQIDRPTNYDECYSFEYIKEDSQLIYPSIYNEIISKKKLTQKKLMNLITF